MLYINACNINWSFPKRIEIAVRVTFRILLTNIYMVSVFHELDCLALDQNKHQLLKNASL